MKDIHTTVYLFPRTHIALLSSLSSLVRGETFFGLKSRLSMPIHQAIKPSRHQGINQQKLIRLPP